MQWSQAALFSLIIFKATETVSFEKSHDEVSEFCNLSRRFLLILIKLSHSASKQIPSNNSEASDDNALPLKKFVTHIQSTFPLVSRPTLVRYLTDVHCGSIVRRDFPFQGVRQPGWGVRGNPYLNLVDS